MEQNNKDFSQIKLEETGLFNVKRPCANALYRYGITTVGQVLDDSLMDSIKKRARLKEVRDDIDGLISVIKHKYLDEPLPWLVYLDQKIGDEIIIDENHKYNGFFQYCIKMGFATAIHRYIDYDAGFKEYYRNTAPHDIGGVDVIKTEVDKGNYSTITKQDDMKIIDFFRGRLEEYDPTKKRTDRNVSKDINLYIMDMYVKAYDKEYNISLEGVVELKDELTKLLNQKKDLDSQMKCLETQIALLEEKISKITHRK